LMIRHNEKDQFCELGPPEGIFPSPTWRWHKVNLWLIAHNLYPDKAECSKKRLP
jgi:hypothetical protein